MFKHVHEGINILVKQNLGGYFMANKIQLYNIYF